MPGEVTFDTGTKTLRVHDGTTLGGFELARTDRIPSGGGGDFDINSVPDEFWQNIVTRFSPTAMQTMESKLSMIANSSYMEYIFNTTATAKFAQVVLVCQTPEAGYAIGDVVASFGILTRNNPTPTTFSDASGLHVRLFVNGGAFWVSHKDTGATTNITNEKWKAKYIVWY